MKIEVKSYYSVGSLLSAIIFFILGAILFNKPDVMIIVFSQVLGGIIVLFGAFKCVKNYIEVRKDNQTSAGEMILGLTLIFIGLIFILLAGVIEAIVRFVIGGWILFIGINRFINSFYVRNKGSKFYAMLIISLLLISAGCYTILVSNLPFKTIGLVLMIYSGIEIVGYILNIFLTDTKINKSSKKNTVKDAKIIEDKSNKKNSK